MTNDMFFMMFDVFVQINMACLTARKTQRTLQHSTRVWIPSGIVFCPIRNGFVILLNDFIVSNKYVDYNPKT